MAKKKESTPPPAVETQELVVSEQQGGALAQVGEWDFGEDANQGFKNLSKGEFAIPWYVLLQSNSDVIKKKLIKGAEGGDILNTVTGELIKAETDPLIVQMVHVERSWVEWTPRDSGNGVAGRHLYTSPEVQEAIARNGGSEFSTKDRPITIGENKLVDTRYLYFLRLEEDGLTVKGMGIMPFWSTKIKQIVNATSAVNQSGLPCPLWSGRVCIRTKLDSKGSDNFNNYVITAFGRNDLRFDTGNLLPPAHPLYKEGKKFFESVTRGTMKADFDVESKISGAGGSEDSKEQRHF